MTCYEIHDTHGAPQCGCEILSFAEWYEIEEYLDNNPDVTERIKEGYAAIVELGDESHHDGVEFVQMTPCDFDEYGTECYTLEWDKNDMTYTYDGIQERPITPTICHIYDVSVNPAVFIGSIETNEDEEYFELLARLVDRYTFDR